VGADVLSVDWRTDMGGLFRRWEGRIPLQGNLDPLRLFAHPDEVEQSALELLRTTDGYPHLFNLGHGVHPETPYDSVVRLVETVHGYTEEG
jgi:uroporphyrinogen decarboxylase